MGLIELTTFYTTSFGVGNFLFFLKLLRTPAGRERIKTLFGAFGFESGDEKKSGRVPLSQRIKELPAQLIHLILLAIAAYFMLLVMLFFLSVAIFSHGLAEYVYFNEFAPQTWGLSAAWIEWGVRYVLMSVEVWGFYGVLVFASILNEKNR